MRILRFGRALLPKVGAHFMFRPCTAARVECTLRPCTAARGGRGHPTWPPALRLPLTAWCLPRLSTPQAVIDRTAITAARPKLTPLRPQLPLRCLQGAALAVFAGMLLGYVAYDCTHYFQHSGLVGGALRAAHMHHHYVDSSVNYGISSSLWDMLLGTLHAKGAKAA